MKKFLALIFAAAIMVSVLPSGTFVYADESVSIDAPKDLPPPEPVPEYESAQPFTDKQFDPLACAALPEAKYRENGIVVGQPKLFELRSLQMMIDNVKASLAQTTYPNTSQLYANTGKVQASESTSTDTSIQVDTSIGSPGSGVSRSAGRPSDSSGHSGSYPEMPGPFALSPTDALSEQTSLWYQLVNLQMLMDGALSDRLIPSDQNGAATAYGNSTQYSPRAQAIVGFQISVDSRQEYRNAVAEAIITIDNKNPALSGHGGYGDEPSLMLLLPRSNTYNSVSVSRDSKSLGFGAVANVLSLGASRDKRSEMFYIGKDTDTVALERIPNLALYATAEPVVKDQTARYRGVSFGWQFRPVFTRDAVDPGVRQVFGMLSLPASVLQSKWEGAVHVTTYWRKYDKKTRTAGKIVDGSLNRWSLDNIIVPIGSGIEEALQPNITRAIWEDAGGGKAAITVEGSNFALGTSIACGEATLCEKDLSLFSSSRIRFVLPVNSVCRGGVTIIGRYGVAKLGTCLLKNDNPYVGVTVSTPKLTRKDDQATIVELILSNAQDPARLVTDRRPVVILNGDVFGAGDKPFTSVTADNTNKTVAVRFVAPTPALAKTDEMVVRDLVGQTEISARW